MICSRPVICSPGDLPVGGAEFVRITLFMNMYIPKADGMNVTIGR